MDHPPAKVILPNYLIISGSGQKVGKTFMALSVIRAFSEHIPMIALKISPHVHDSFGVSILTVSEDGFRIFQDTEPNAKNSGKFLQAGVLRSYFMETDDAHLPDAFDHFRKICNPENLALICESGALASIVQPGILIYISDRSEETEIEKVIIRHHADIILSAKKFDSAETTGRIDFSEGRWLITR